MISWRPIIALPVVLCSQLADACDTFMIGGRVADPEPGVDMWIGVFEDPPADGAAPVDSAWVDAEEFELEVPCAESVTLLAARKGSVPLAKRVRGFARTTGELRFEPGLALTGTVRSDENLPIDGARISVTRIDVAEAQLPESLTTWRSSKDGAFVVGGLVLGTYRLTASADGHSPVELPEVVIEEGTANRVVIRLPTAVFIAGRVVDTSGLAVAGAEVHWELATRGGTTEETTAATDSEGAFRIGPFREGRRVLISARADLSRSDAEYYVAPRNDLNLTLHQAVQIRGTVSNAFTGELLRDFVLNAYGSGESRSFAFRGAAGEFAAPIYWHTHMIVISTPGFVPWHRSVDFRSGGGEHDFGNVALEPERVVTGRILDAASGLPVQGAWVRRWYDESNLLDGPTLFIANRLTLVARTDEHGRFRLSGLPRDDLHLVAKSMRHGLGGTVVELPAGMDRIDIEVNFATATIEGMLVTEQGTPARGSVFIREDDGTGGGTFGGPLGQGIGPLTGHRVDQGEFRFVVGAEDQRYRLGGESDAGIVESRIVAVRNGESVTGIRLVVLGLGRVSGLLTGLEKADRAKLSVLDVHGRSVQHSPWLQRGIYSLQGVPEGRFTLRARTTSGRAISREFESDGQGEFVVDLVFAGASRLGGVVTAGGRPVPGIEIEATPRDKTLTSGESRTMSNGTYVIDGLDDGKYVVRVRGRSSSVELSGDTHHDVELGWLAVSGTVTAEGPVLGALVTATPTSAEGGPGGEDWADSRGSFRIDGLDAGEYTVHVSHPGHREVSRNVHLVSVIENFEVHLSLSPTDGRCAEPLQSPEGP